VRVDTSLVPIIEVDPELLDFGDVTVGQEATLSVDIRNNGGASLSVSQLFLNGAGRTSYRVTEGTGGFTVAPGAAVRRDVVFEPDAAGAKLAELEFRSDDAATTIVRVSLSGNGIGVPQIAVTPAPPGPVEFGEVELGVEAARTVTLRNPGTGDLTLTRVELSPAGSPDFSIASGAGGGVLAPGASRRVELVFAPESDGAKSSTLRIESDDVDVADRVIDMQLTGTGLRSGDEFRRGDSNQDGRVDISDGIRIINRLFLGAEPFLCDSAVDANDDGRQDVSDAIKVFGFLFIGESAPTAPGPFECGLDPTPDSLDCQQPVCP